MKSESILRLLIKQITASKNSKRILIDGTCVTREKAGVGVYVFNLVRELAGLEFTSQIYLLAQDDDPDMFRYNDRITILPVPSRLARKLPLRFIFEQLVLPCLLLALRIDVLHSVHYSFPLLRFRARQVVTLHDMTSFKMPEVHLRMKVLYFKFFILAAARIADHLIFVSASARSDFSLIAGPHRPTMTVTPLGKDERFHSHIPHGLIEIARINYSIPGEYVLYVGTLEPRKNLVRLVEAFHAISNEHPETYLVIAGKKGWMYEDLFTLVKALALETKVVFTGFIRESEKPALIAGAKVFAYPSLYEGFGIPVLEALACGVPVVTSNISSIPEVAGEAAILINPHKTSELSMALRLLLSDGELRKTLSMKAQMQASRFSWTQTAMKTLEVYNSLYPKADPSRSAEEALSK